VEEGGRDVEEWFERERSGREGGSEGGGGNAEEVVWRRCGGEGDVDRFGSLRECGVGTITTES
jgi:hypothetical protein